MNTMVIDTPYYVLLNDKQRIGPNVVQPECSPIYGFSDKEFYDKFCLHSDLALTPYPLVKGYLREQVDAPGAGAQLVVVDATGPAASYVRAATMRAVLEAHENRSIHMDATYRLKFDQQANAYREEPGETAALVADLRTLRCDRCKVAIHDDLAIECPVCGSQFDSIVSNHAGLAKKLDEKRVEAGVRSCSAR